MRKTMHPKVIEIATAGSGSMHGFNQSRSGYYIGWDEGDVEMIQKDIVHRRRDQVTGEIYYEVIR